MDRYPWLAKMMGQRGVVKVNFTKLQLKKIRGEIDATICDIDKETN